MPRWLKFTLRALGILAGLVLVLWLGLASYVYTHKKQLLETVTTQLNENINGKLTIEHMEPALLQGFPGISVSLKNVLLRDSLWNKHKHDLVNAKSVFVAVDAFSMVVGTIKIRNLTINDGTIYLFTDSNGLSNTNLFKKTIGSGTKKEGMREKINQLNLNHVQVTIDNKQKNKLFNFAIDKVAGTIKYAGPGWNGRVKIQTLVQNFEFNTRRGSFMKGKQLNADLSMTYSHKKHQLDVQSRQFAIGGNEFNIGGKFMFAENSSDFELEVEAPSIKFEDAASLLTPNISSKLKEYSFTDAINAKAVIKGRLKNGGEPRINVSMAVKNNTLLFAGEKITGCSFTGKFTNEVVKGSGFTDPNSAIIIDNLVGNLYDIPFKADSVKINNLKYPVFSGLFSSNFSLTKLNKAMGSNFNFHTGQANLNLLFKVPYDQNNKAQRYIFGTVKVNGASAEYIPRNMLFKNASLTMNFKGQDLFLENMNVQTRNSSLRMQASLLNFSNLYYTNPGKLLVDWKVNSPQINLNEFLVFLGKRNYKSNAPANSFSKKLDQMLAEANMRLRVNVNKVIYKRFTATNVSSDIILKQAGISIKNLSLRQGGGSLRIDGEVDQSGSLNNFNIISHIDNVDVQKLFYAFENFGQTGITDANLRGNLFGSTTITGAISDKGQVVPRSFRGAVNFDIRNGALVNFEPMEKVGAFAFPNRDFKNITFSSLKNTLDIRGDKINIRPMQIESSVLNVFLEGVYSLTTGTNIALKIPLRNPKKDEMIANKDEKAARALKGIVINLRAIDGEDGKVKFKLGKRAPDGYGEQKDN